MSWVAKFRDGPCVADERSWAVGPIEKHLYLIEHPRRDGEWMLVGYESIVPENPWPNQITYRLAEVNYREREEPVAYYELVP